MLLVWRPFERKKSRLFEGIENIFTFNNYNFPLIEGSNILISELTTTQETIAELGPLYLIFFFFNILSSNESYYFTTFIIANAN